MSSDIEVIGIRLDTSDVERGITSLDQLAATGPKVEGSLKSVEATAARTGKSIASLGAGAASGLDGLPQKINPAAQAVDKLGVSAGQTAAALRQLPAQFSDIIVSLQGGQAPLSVFLQQGSQIKDSFGGAGAALKAMGGYVLGLVNPLTLAAAAAGGLAYAFSQGASEAQEFRKSVILTGGAAGVSAGQLMDMAAAVKQLGGGTQGRAAEILNQMAQTALVGASNLTRFTDAALKLEKVGGPAAEETAKAFDSLGRSPAAAAMKLNEATGFLTRSLYEQIRGLEDVGKVTEAARVAQEGYAAAIEQRTPAIRQNLGYIENAWLGIKAAAKGAIDASLSVGRDTTTTELIAKKQQQLDQLRGRNGSIGIRDGLVTRQLQNEINLLKQAAGYEAQSAAAQGQIADGVKAANRFLDEQVKYLSHAELAARAIKVETNKAAEATQGLADGSSEYAAIQEALAKRIALIKQQADPGTNIEAIKRAEAIRAEEVKRGIDSINTLRTQGYLNEYEQIEQVTRLQLAGLDSQRNSLTAQLGIVSKRQDAERESAALRTQIAVVDQQKLTAQADGENKVTEAIQKHKVAAMQLGEVVKAEDEAARSEFLREQAKLRNQLVGSIQIQTQSLKDESGLLDLERSLLGESNEVRDAAIAQYRITLDLKRQILAIDSPNSGLDQAERERLRAEAQANAAAAKLNAVRRAEMDEWKTFFDDINRGLTDSLYRAFESGKGFFKTLWDGIRNTFKTTVLKLAVQAVMNPVNQLIAGSLGLSGVANAAAGAAGASGLTGSLLGALGLGGLSLGSIGSAIGAGFMSTIGGGTIGGGGAAGLLAGGAAPGTGLAGSIGAALPWVGGALLIANALGVFRTTKTVGGGITGTLGAGDIQNFEVRRKSGTLFSGPDYSTPTIGVAAQSQALQDAYNALRDQAGVFAKALGMSGEAVKNFTVALGSEKLSDDTGGLGIRLEGLSADQVAEKVKAALATANDALARQVLGTYADAFKKEGETASVTLERLAGNLTGVNSVLNALGQTALAASVQGADMASKLADQFGGLSTFQSLSSQYFDAYYTEAQRTALVTAGLTKSLEGLNLGLPSSREAFRALVEGQDLTTEAGRKTYAALLQLAPAFASITAATDDLTGAVDGSAAAIAEAARVAAEAGRKALADLASDRQGLEVDLLRAQGNNTGADALARQQALTKLTTGLSAADAIAATAAFEYNETLRAQAEVLRAATAAVEDAAAKAAAVASQRSGLESQLLQIQGNTAALREREIAALDESNRELQRRIYTEQDAAAKASQRYGIESQILQLQGDTVALRARELATLDETNRALQQHYYDLVDEKAAAEAAAQALQHVTDVMAGLGNTRFDLENRLLTLQGSNAEVAARTRERDLAQLTAGLSTTDAQRVTAAYDLNLALQRQIADTEAAQKAAEDYAQAQAQAAQESARAAEALKNAWQSVTDSIFAEVARIRGLITGTSAQSLAGAQAQFSITSAQARAGDLDAAKLLPSLSQTLLTLAEANATTLIELQRIRAQTAASLAGTGGLLSGQFGLNIPRMATGTNYVPQDMLAILHRGEEVTPVAYNPAAGGRAGQEVSVALLAEVQALRVQVSELQQSAGVTAESTKKTKEMFANVTRGGDAMITEAAT